MKIMKAVAFAVTLLIPTAASAGADLSSDRRGSRPEIRVERGEIRGNPKGDRKEIRGNLKGDRKEIRGNLKGEGGDRPRIRVGDRAGLPETFSPKGGNLERRRDRGELRRDLRDRRQDRREFGRDRQDKRRDARPSRGERPAFAR